MNVYILEIRRPLKPKDETYRFFKSMTDEEDMDKLAVARRLGEEVGPVDVVNVVCLGEYGEMDEA